MSPLKSLIPPVLLMTAALAQAAELRSDGIDAASLSEMLETDTPMLVIDVRAPDSFSSGHIPGAVNMPAPIVTKYLDQIEQAQDVVLYCNDSQLTAVAEQLLLQSKVTGFSHLEGGLSAWTALSLPLETALPE